MVTLEAKLGEVLGLLECELLAVLVNPVERAESSEENSWRLRW